MLSLVALALLAAAPPPPELVRYTLVESIRTLTPNGERSQAVGGTVTVLGELARWDLSGGGTFPRARADAVVDDGRALVLLARKDRHSAGLAADELDLLFVPPPSPEAGAAVALVDRSISVLPDGAGKPLGELPTRRFRVAVRAVHRLTAIGRVTTMTTETTGTIETAELPRSRFDGLLRLFTVRGETRDELEAELATLPGVPVRVSLESSAETNAESVGGGPPAEGLRRLRTTTTAKRTVEGVLSRASTKEDVAVFAVPDDYRSLGLERLLAEGPALR